MGNGADLGNGNPSRHFVVLFETHMLVEQRSDLAVLGGASVREAVRRSELD